MVEFNPYSWSFHEDPYPLYQECRARGCEREIAFPLLSVMATQATPREKRRDFVLE